MSTSPLMIVSTLMGSLTMSIIQGINRFMPGYYMDEEFHVDQMEHYCREDFEYWNPKLSTPPGLYTFTYPLTKIAQLYYGTIEEACAPGGLRLLNGIWIVLLHQIITRMLMGGKVGPVQSEMHASLTAVNIIILPVFYMSTWLYYTDLMSTTFVLLMYAFYTMKRPYSPYLATLFGVMSMYMRQTNIVWVFFVMALHLYDVVLVKKYKCPDDLQAIAQHLYKVSTKSRTSFRKLIGAFIWSSFPYMFAVVGSVFMTWSNGGLAYGDKTAHQPKPHIVQLGYMLLFMCVHGWVHLLPLSLTVAHHMWNRRRLYFSLMLASVFIVHFFTYVHPYLLADNRHYTFYIWRRLIDGTPYTRYMLAPFYVIAMAFVTVSLTDKSPVWVLGYGIACILVVVPNVLLELRYFILPYMMWRIHTVGQKENTWAKLMSELMMNVIVNAGVLYLFAMRPFEWEHEEGVVQRFMW